MVTSPFRESSLAVMARAVRLALSKPQAVPDLLEPWRSAVV